MKNYIDINDIIEHQKIFSESSDTVSSRAYNLYKIVSENPVLDNCIAFLKECSSSASVANEFISECVDIVENNMLDNLQITRIFRENFLPKCSPSNIANQISQQYPRHDDAMLDMLKYQYNKSIYAEAVWQIHETVMEKWVEYPFDKSVSTESLISKCCNTVSETADAKYSSISDIAVNAVNESIYNLQKIGRDYDQIEVIKAVFEYFNITDNDYTKAIRLLQGDPMLKEYCIWLNEDAPDLATNLGKSDRSVINQACTKFITRERDFPGLIALKAVVLSADEYDIKNNIGRFFCVLDNMIRHSSLSTSIVQDIIPNLYDEISDSILINSMHPRVLLTSIKDAVDNMIFKMDKDLKIHLVDESKVTDAINYITEMKKLSEQLSSGYELLYTDYALECMLINTVTENSEPVSSTKEFKLFKFDNVITRCYKIDKFLKNKFGQLKDKVKSTIKTIGTKIFEESSIYEMLDYNGNLDYCVSSFYISHVDNTSELHEICTNAIKYINENMDLGGSVCYYVINPDTVEFRLREQYNIKFTDEDIKIKESTISTEDIRRLGIISEAADLYKEEYDESFIRESWRFFRRNPNPAYFETYLECASLMGVSKEVVHEIYDSIFENKRNLDLTLNTFGYMTSHLVEEYQPMSCDIDVVIESAEMIQTILEADNGRQETDRQKAAREKREAQLAQWEKEEEEDENKKSSNSNDNNQKDNNKKEDQKKDTNNQQQNKSVDNKDGKKLEASEKLVKALNNIKLYAHGLRGKMKKANTKAKTVMQNMDMASDRLMKSIKKALVSDRREAIIKGSIIPSFHKCILLAAGLCGIAIIDFPLAIIVAVGGLAVSKNLTKKERALLYDDIMIELKILDKELQRAEDKNQIKKMRKLMQAKKELERQAARIQYNIRIGKDLIPGGKYINRDDD